MLQHETRKQGMQIRVHSKSHAHKKTETCQGSLDPSDRTLTITLYNIIFLKTFYINIMRLFLKYYVRKFYFNMMRKIKYKLHEKDVLGMLF